MHVYTLAEAVAFQEIQCLLNFHHVVGHQGIEINFIHVSGFVFHSVFLCQLHPHTYAIKNVLAEIVFCGFPRKTVFT